MNSDKIAHLGFIQVIIARMGANSFFLKGWSITLIGAMFALSADKANTKFIYIAYAGSFLFWLMDAYFLRQEKLFRELYNRVADGTILSDRFTLTTGGHNSEVGNIFLVFITPTLLFFHLGMLGLIYTANCFAH